MIKGPLVELFIRFLRQERVMREADRQFALRHRHTPALANSPGPYEELAEPAATTGPTPAVFITARFRSGSTLLWQLFRQLEGCTAFYEPLNERQWFDAGHRGERVDASHRGVHDYWREYDGLEDLGQWYREDWIREGLYMDEACHDPALRRYIDALIAAADGTAVLQFNRVDFRLPWLRRQFPQVPIIHLYRHPRDQWLSFLADKATMGPEQVEKTYRDGFYLDVWCRDLARYYPFLHADVTPHPYRRFYYLWKLSWLFGQRYASVSIAFEDLVTETQGTLRTMLDAIGWAGPVDEAQLAAQIAAPPLGRWRDYASASWFAGHEAACEAVLSRQLSPAVANDR